MKNTYRPECALKQRNGTKYTLALLVITIEKLAMNFSKTVEYSIAARTNVIRSNRISNEINKQQTILKETKKGDNKASKIISWYHKIHKRGKKDGRRVSETEQSVKKSK